MPHQRRRRRAGRLGVQAARLDGGDGKHAGGHDVSTWRRSDGGDEYNFVSDVWSLGIIVLEALLGEHLFGVTFMALFNAITKAQTPPPPDDTPPELAALLCVPARGRAAAAER